MEQREVEKEALTIALQDRLIKFASSETTEREHVLPELVAFIKESVDEKVMGLLVDKEFQARFEKAIERTLQTPFVIATDVPPETEGRKVNPWKGSATICAIDSTGTVLAAHTNPEEELAHYGDLNQYSLIKALSDLHLDKAGKIGNLSDPGNFRYLISLGLKPFDDIFAGSAEKPTIDESGRKFFVAGSGCHAEKSYLKDLLAGAEPAPDTLAGRLDEIFSTQVANFIENPNQPTTQTPEPRELQQIRLSN